MTKKYDGLYIFAGAAKDEALDKLVEKARGEITRLSGTVVGTEVIGKRTFARTMQKRDSGVYVRIRFELDPANVQTLLSRYHLLEEFFRVQILMVDERREQIVADQAAKRKARAEAQAAADAEALAAEHAAAADLADR